MISVNDPSSGRPLLSQDMREGSVFSEAAKAET
jgi:hypothetical protein